MKIPGPGALPADPAAVAGPARRESALFRGVLMCAQTSAESSFPIASTARWQGQSLDPVQWRARKAARPVSTFPDPQTSRKDCEPGRRRDRPRRFPWACVPSALFRLAITLPAVQSRSFGRDRSESRTHQSTLDHNLPPTCAGHSPR